MDTVSNNTNTRARHPGTWHRPWYARFLACTLLACLFVPMVPGVHAQSDDESSSVPGFFLYLGPQVIGIDPEVPYSSPTASPSMPVLFSERRERDGEVLSYLPLAIRLDTRARLSSLDWLLMEVVLTRRSAGLVPAATLGTPPMLNAEYAVVAAGGQIIGYTDVPFVLTRDHPDADPESGELRLYTVLFHGDGIVIETVAEHSGGLDVLDTVTARVIPEQCRARTASAQVPLVRGGGVSIGTSSGFRQPDGSVLFDSFGTELSSLNNNSDFHGDQVFTITARVACGSGSFAGAGLAQVAAPRPEHSITVRMRDDDVPRLWFDPLVAPLFPRGDEGDIVLRENDTPDPRNRLPGLVDAANATRYALVSAGNVNRLQPNYSAAPLGVRVAITERSARYGEDVVFLDADDNPVPGEALGSTHEVVLQVLPGARAAFSAPLVLVDDNYIETGEKSFAWGFRSDSDGTARSPFPYVPAPANSEGYQVTTFYGSDDLLSHSVSSILLTITDDDVLRVAHEALPAVLVPGEEIVYGYSLRDAVPVQAMPRITIDASLAGSPSSMLSDFFVVCNGSVLCNLDDEGSAPPYFDAGAALGSYVPLLRLRARADVDFSALTVTIALETTSTQPVELAAPLVLRGLAEMPLVTLIALSGGATPPAALERVSENTRSLELMEPNPAGHCPGPEYYAAGRSPADCEQPEARFELYAVLLQSSPTSDVVVANRLGGGHGVAVPYHLPEDNDYSWTPASLERYATIGQGESSVHLGSLVIEADHLLEGDERIPLRVSRPRDSDAILPGNTRLAVDYQDLPESLRTIAGFSDMPGITIVDADSYFYTPLVYPVISTIREDLRQDLPVTPEDFGVPLYAGSGQPIYDIQAGGYRGLPWGIPGGDAWEPVDNVGAAVSVVMPSSATLSPVRLADSQGTVRFYSAEFSLPDAERYQVCDSAIDTYDMRGEWFPRPLPTGQIGLGIAYTSWWTVLLAGGAFNNLYQELLNMHLGVREAVIRTTLFSSCPSLANLVTEDGLVNISMPYAPSPSTTPSQLFYVGDPGQLTLEHAIVRRELDYLGKREIEFHYAEGGALGRAFGTSLEVDGVARMSSTTVLVDEIPGALAVGPENSDVPLRAVSGTTLRYTFRAAAGLTLRLSVFATGPASESVLAPEGQSLSDAPVLLPVALYAHDDPGRSLMRAEVAPWRFADTEEQGVRGHSTLYLGFLEQGDTPAHLDFASLQCDSDPVRSRSTVDDLELAHDMQGGYYASVPHAGGATGLADYTLELGMPTLRRPGLTEIDEPFLAIESAIHCVRSHLSQYRNHHSLKCSDTREAITGTPPDVCAATTQTVTLDIPRSLSVRTLRFSKPALREGLSPEDTVFIELSTEEPISTDIPPAEALQWTMQFDGTDTRLRYNADPLPADGRLSVSFVTSSSATRYDGERFLLSQGMLTLDADDALYQPDRVLNLYLVDDGAPDTIRAPLTLIDRSDNVFGIAPTERSLERTLVLSNVVPPTLPLRLAHPPTADTEVRGRIENDLILMRPAGYTGPFEPIDTIFDVVPLTEGDFVDVQIRREPRGGDSYELFNTYTFSAVFPAGQQTVDALRLEFSEEYLALVELFRGTLVALAAPTIRIDIDSVSNFPLTVVANAQESALGLANTFEVLFMVVTTDTVSLPSNTGLRTGPELRAREGSTLNYNLAVLNGMSVRLSLDALSAHYDGSELIWSVGTDSSRTRIARTIDSANLRSSDVYLTFHLAQQLPEARRARCPGISPENEILLPFAIQGGPGEYGINLELPEDGGDYYGTGDAATARLVVDHEIACVSDTVGGPIPSSYIAIPCDSFAVIGEPEACALRDPVSGKSTVTITVDDNDTLRLERIDFARNLEPTSPLYAGPASISEPLPAGSMPGDIVPVHGSTLTVVVQLTGTNYSLAPIPLALRLQAEDAYAQLAHYGDRALGASPTTFTVFVPVDQRSGSDTLSLSIPANELYYHRPGILHLADGSADALDPPESTTVRVLDLGDGYYEFGEEHAEAPSLGQGQELPIRVRLLAPVAEETTVRISFESTINDPAGEGLASSADFMVRPGTGALADTLVSTTPTADRVLSTVTLRFMAGEQELEALRIRLGSSFYTGATEVVEDHVTIRMGGSLGPVPAERIVVMDEPGAPGRPLRTALSVGSAMIREASVVVHAPGGRFLEGHGTNTLFSISTLSSDGMAFSYPVEWTLSLRLDDARRAVQRVWVSPASVDMAVESGGIGMTSTTFLLRVPAYTTPPITIGARFKDRDEVLHDARIVETELLALRDAPETLQISTGTGSTAAVTVVDSTPLSIGLFPGPYINQPNHLGEGERTNIGFVLLNQDHVSMGFPGYGPDFVVSPDNAGPIVIATIQPGVNSTDTATYGGRCQGAPALADYCIFATKPLPLTQGMRWIYAPFGDDASEYLALEADPGAVLPGGVYDSIITLQTLTDTALETTEHARLDAITDRYHFGRRDNVPRGHYDVSYELTIFGQNPDTPLGELMPGEFFYSARPLAITEDGSAIWAVALVNSAGMIWRNELGRVVRMGLEPLGAPVHRGFSAASLRAIFDREGGYDEVVHGEALVFDIGVHAGSDADAINEIGFLELYQIIAGIPAGGAIPPHPALGVDNGMPALRVYVDDDDALATVQLQRYELADDDTVVAAPGPGLDGTVIQGAAAFVSASVVAPNPLHAARRRSSFGVAFAPGRDPAMAPPFESASPLLREESSSYHYVLLAFSIGSTGSTSFDYQTITQDGRLGNNDSGFAGALMELRVGQWASGRIGAAPARYSGTAGDAHLLLLTNDPDFLSRAPADAAPRRSELIRICPVLAEAGLTSTTVGALAVSDGSRYNDAAFHLLDVRSDGAYYGFREDAASVEVELLCASDPVLSPDLADNNRADGSMGAEFCAARMVDNRCLLDTTDAQLDYQNYLPGFHDDDNAAVTLQLARAHNEVLIEPDNERGITASDARTRVGVTVQGIEMQLHADHGGDSIAFLPRANRLGAASAALQLELAWDDTVGAALIAAQELAMSAPGMDPASSSSSLLVLLSPLPSGEDIALAITVAARADDRYEHCLNHRFFADLDADLGYLDTGSSTDLHRRTRRNLCRQVDDPALDEAVRTELAARGRAPSFRLLPALRYLQPEAGAGDVTRQLEFADNAFEVHDSDSYARLVVGNTALSESDTDSAVTVQVQFGGNRDTRYGNATDATTLLPVDLALVISGDAEHLGIRYIGSGVMGPVVVPTSTANVDVEITLEDPRAHALSYDPLGLRGMWLDTGLSPGDSSVRELLLLGEDAGVSTATRYDLEADNSADPVLGNIVSIVRLRGLVPAAEPIDVMRISVVDDDAVEGSERFAVQLGILSASQSSETDSASNRRIHSQRSSSAGNLDDVLVDSSQGIEQDYSAALNELRAAGRSVRTAATVEISDNEMPDIIVRDNTRTVIIRENDLPRNEQEAIGVDTGQFPIDPEGDDYQEELSSISAPDIIATGGSGVLLRIDLESPVGTRYLPPDQDYQVLYHYAVPTTLTVRHEVDVPDGDAVYLLLGDPGLVEAGGSCAGRVTGLGTPDKPLIVVGEHPSPGGVPLDIRDQLPDGGFSARLFFSAQDDGGRYFNMEGLFNYGVTLLCSDSVVFDPDNPGTGTGASFCVSDGSEPNLVEDDPVDGGAACTVHRSRDYAVRDLNYALVVTIDRPGGAGTNLSENLVVSYDEPDAERPEIGRPAIAEVENNVVTMELRHRIYGTVPGAVYNDTLGAYVLPDLDELFVTPFAGRASGAPFVDIVPGAVPPDRLPISSVWFQFSTQENDYLDGVDRVVELSLPLDMLPGVPGRVAHARIRSGLLPDAPGYTDFVLGAEFSAALHLRDSDNYYYYVSTDPTGRHVPERDDDSAAEAVRIAFGASRLSEAILDADPLAGELIGMRIERAAIDTSNIPGALQPATLGELRLHNLDALPGPGLSDPGSVLPPGSIAETEIIAGQDSVRLVAMSSTSSGFLDDTARVPFYFGASFDNGLMRLFDIGAAHDLEQEGDEGLDLTLDVRFLGRPAAGADFGLRAEPSAFLNGARSSVGTALPITIPFETRSPYAELHLSTDTRVTTRYLLDESDVSTPTAPTLAVWSFTDRSLPDAPLLIAVDLLRSELRRNVFFDDARVALARGDGAVPTSNVSTDMRHCEDEDCNNRRYRMYLQLGPYTGDDEVVLRAVSSDISDPHAAQRASCAAGLVDPIDRAAPYLVANVLRNPAPGQGVPAYNDADPRYELADDGRQLRLVLSDDGVESERVPLLDGMPETVLYDEVGIAALRFSILCSDDPDYADPRVTAVCAMGGEACASWQDAVLVVRGPTLVYRFALERNDDNPLFITDPVLALHEPDAPATDPLPERFGQLDFPERNAPSMGTELQVYATLASGPTPGSGLHNSLRLGDGGSTGLELVSLAPREFFVPTSGPFSPRAHSLCVPRGRDQAQNYGGDEPGDAVVGDCELIRASASELDQTHFAVYVGRVRVLDDDRWEPIAADEFSEIAYPGQRGYYIPGDELAAVPEPDRVPWLTTPSSRELQSGRDNEPLLQDYSVAIPRLSARAEPARLQIRDAEATLSLSFDDSATVVDDAAQLDRNTQTVLADTVRMRLHVGSKPESRELPLGFPALAEGTGLRLPPVVPGCRAVRRATVDDYNHRLALMVAGRASDGSARDSRDFLDDGALSAAFSLNHGERDQSQPACVTPYADPVHGRLLPATLFDAAPSNPLYYDLVLGPGSIVPSQVDATADYSFVLAPRTEILDSDEAHGPDNSAADALYRLYDTPDGSYSRSLRIRMGDAHAPIVCTGVIDDTRSVDEVRGSERDCLVAEVTGPYVVRTSWTLAADYRIDSGSSTATADTFVALDGALPTPVSPRANPPVIISPLSTLSPYGLHYYALEQDGDECAAPTTGVLPPAYRHHVGLFVDSFGEAPLQYTLEAREGMRPGHRHCMVLSASDGLYTSYTEAVAFTLPVYEPTRDENDNGIPDQAETPRYPIPEDSTDTATAGDAYTRAYCDEVSPGGYSPGLGGRNDCDEDGVPDVVELVFGTPNTISPMDDDRVQSVMCFAASLRTRLPLPENARLQCSGDGAELLSAMSEEWRIVLEDTSYRGLDYVLEAAMADETPGPNSGGLLPSSYWLVDPEFSQLLHFMLLPRVVLDAPPRVPVYTRYDYVDGGKVLHPGLVGRPSEEQRFTHRGESYRVPGSSSTLYYVVTENSLDPERALSLPQELGVRLFGSTAAVDELSYYVELLSEGETTPTRLSARTGMQSGAIGSERALITDVTLITTSALSFTRGRHTLSVVLRARSDASTSTLTLERRLGATVQGLLAGDDELRARMVAVGEGATEPGRQFPYGYPLQLNMRMSGTFYAAANTPRHAPLVHFTPNHDDPDQALTTLNVDAIASSALRRARVEWHVLNYASGREVLLSTQLLSGIGDSDTAVSWPGARSVSTDDICATLGGCDFDADPDAFYLFQLRATLVGDARVEAETELPPGTYVHTHNRHGAGSTTEERTVSPSEQLRVVYDRPLSEPVELARVTQTVQLGGPVPSDDANPESYTDADYDGVPDDKHRAHATWLDFSAARVSTPVVSAYDGRIETPVRFARVHLGGYGRSAHQRRDRSEPLPLQGANIAQFGDSDGNYPEYPARDGREQSDFALDFFIACDTRAERDQESGFDGSTISVGIALSVPVQTECLGALTPVLFSFPAGAVLGGVLPAQIVTLNPNSDPSVGYERAPTGLCEFMPGNTEVSEELEESRAANGCPDLIVHDGRSADSGDSFAFADFNSEGVCPDVHDDSQWTRINEPAEGGERCLRLLISDNGPNDLAPVANVIADPLVWSGDVDFSGDGPSFRRRSGGGGTVDPWSLFALLMLALLFGGRIARQRLA